MPSKDVPPVPNRPASVPRALPPSSPASGPRGGSATAELFARAFETLAAACACEHAELAVMREDGSVELLMLARGQSAPARSVGARADWSARLWHDGEQPLLVPDPARELDPGRAGDCRWLERGVRALASMPLRCDGGPLGLLVAGGAFDATSAALLAPTATLLAIALERERGWSVEAERHRRRVRLEAALPTIARSLDVRKVFAELSGLIQEVIPHHVLAFALLLPDRSGVRVQAATERGVVELPVYRFSNDEERLDANWEFLLAYDLEPVDAGSVRARISPRSAPEVVEVVTTPGPEWMAFVRQAGVRSILRVPIRSKGSPIGGVVFMFRAPDAYDDEDGLVASRIADQLALALAHQELAEEERRIALAEERARALERRVDQLSDDLERFTAHRAIGQSVRGSARSPTRRRWLRPRRPC